MTTPAVRDLNMVLTRISSDLQFVSHRLEAHLREVSREGSKGGNLPDLAKLSKRITTLKTNIPLLEKHAENLTKSKAEVLEKLSTVSLENHNKMVAVYERLGFGAGGGTYWIEPLVYIPHHTLLLIKHNFRLAVN